MASSLVHSNKTMKRLESRKSHSWWWDSHISPKNSKWLMENVEEMDQNIKRMLKLIEEDADSFAKKAEMYYQKRPVLISHVEDFYRMYRSLAERYDHLTGELRKNISSDLQSQGSIVSDPGSEPSSTWPSPDQRLGRRKSSNRAAGFDFFLGSGGSNSDAYQKEGDESSSLSDSEPESDVSSVNNYSAVMENDSEVGFNRKTIELEIELRELKEKLKLKQEENVGSSFGEARIEKSEDFLARMAGYEEDLRVANKKIRISEEEIMRLNVELQKYKLLDFPKNLQTEFESASEKDVKIQEGKLDMEVSNLGSDVVEELRITKERLKDSEKEVSSIKVELEKNRSSEKIRSLQDQLESAQKDTSTWKAKLNAERREVSKLQERITRLKASLSDREHEIRDLKIAVSDAEQKIFPEKAQVKAEISKLIEERALLEEQIRECESRGRVLEEEIRKVKGEKAEIEESLKRKMEQLKADILDRTECVERLNTSIIAIKSERDKLNEELVTFRIEVSSKDEQIDQMNEQMSQLHKEHMELIAGTERANELVEELRSRVKELETEIERQRVMIIEGAEQKREAIRQLCFSLEHYRNGYQSLRQAFIGHKRVPVMAV